MKPLLLSISILLLTISVVKSQTVSLTGGTYTQNFDALSNVPGSTTNLLTIPGWALNETGGGARDNDQYGVDIGATNTGDTYSYGTASTTDRAFGSIRSTTLISTFGIGFTNNTGSTITSLNIAFTGEQWRLGTAARTDQINFQYSLDATSLTTGTYTNFSQLNFLTPNTQTVGAKDGNAVANRTALSASITGLNIANGSTFWLRWSDEDATTADDGLAIDDFSITPQTGVLAITGLNFKATKDRGMSQLKWTTEQELNNSHFVIQRSGDGTSWGNIAQLAAVGNSNTTTQYSFDDDNPLKGSNFYRLQIVGADNKITYSDIRRLQFADKDLYSVFPNPAKELIRIRSGSVGIETDMQILDASGRIMINSQFITGPVPKEINVERLSPGLFYIRLTPAKSEAIMLCFIKRF
jgi:hypothetical protein